MQIIVFLQQSQTETDVEQKGDIDFGLVLTFLMSWFLFPHKDIVSQFEVSRGEIFNIELKMHVHKRC